MHVHGLPDTGQLPPERASPLPRGRRSRKLHPVHRSVALIGPLALAVLLTACGRAPTPAPEAAASPKTASAGVAHGDPWLDDGRPQAGLPRLKVYLGPQELNAELALTTEAIQKGMMWRTNVAESEGMLFVFGRAHQTAFWMKNVPMDIDVAYLDPEGVIREIHRLGRQNTNPVPARAPNIQYALETAVGWYERHGIREGVVVRTERGSLPETFFPTAARR